MTVLIGGAVGILIALILAITVSKPRQMCFRCGRRSKDVPCVGGYCVPCQEVLDRIALSSPAVFLEYVREARKSPLFRDR